MMNRFLPGVILAGAFALIAGTNGCSSSNPITDAQKGLCCSAFQPGTDMTTADFGVDASIQGQMAAFANATGDLSAVAGTAMADVTGACRNIATDLGNDPNDAGANGKTGVDLLNFWCGAATAKITATVSVSVQGSLTLSVTPPECSVSVTAQASCQGGCDVSGKCDVKANPPTCTGGQVELSCTGSCTGSASATIDCSGSCSGTCSGSCVAQGGVDCTGKCDGTCTAKAGVGTGTGAQADGTCNGTCSGTCSVTAPGVKCSGTCSGKCDATCAPPQGQATVNCSAGCSGSATPISCKGGKLEGGCKVDASCQANCNASAQAKATCTPPSVSIQGSIKAGADVQFAALVTTLKTNLPALLLVIQAQGKSFAADIQASIQGGASLTTSGNLSAAGGVCVADMVVAATAGAANFAATLQASINVSTAIGGPTG